MHKEVYFIYFLKVKNWRGPRHQLGNWQKLDHVHLQGNIHVLIKHAVTKANLVSEMLIIKAKVKN